MRQITFNEHLTELTQTNPLIDEFISSHIYDWSCFSEYHCQKQKMKSSVRFYSDFIEVSILGMSIRAMLQMEQKTILRLLKKKSETKGYSELEIWMLRDIKNRVMTVYSAFSNRSLL